MATLRNARCDCDCCQHLITTHHIDCPSCVSTVQLLTSFIVYHFKTWDCQVSQVSIMKLSLKFGLADYNAISPDRLHGSPIPCIIRTLSSHS